MNSSTANLYYVKAKRETRSKVPMATFSEDGSQRWARTHGVAREEGFTNDDFQEGEPRVQRKPNMENAYKRTPPDVELKVYDQGVEQQKTGGYGHHEHNRHEYEDLGSQMGVFINPQHPEHFSNESPEAMKATVAKAKKAHGGKKPKAPKKKAEVVEMTEASDSDEDSEEEHGGAAQVRLKNPRVDPTSVFSSGTDKLEAVGPSMNIPKKPLYKKRVGKTPDLVMEARAEQKSLLGGARVVGGRAGPHISTQGAMALSKAIRDDPAGALEEVKKVQKMVKKVTGPLKTGMRVIAPFAGEFKGLLNGIPNALEKIGLGKEEKEGGKKSTKKAHASKGKKSARGALVSKIMKERGVKLGEASKIIKAEGLL
jgi:hypothetical protein